MLSLASSRLYYFRSLRFCHYIKTRSGNELTSEPIDKIYYPEGAIYPAPWLPTKIIPTPRPGRFRRHFVFAVAHTSWGETTPGRFFVSMSWVLRQNIRLRRPGRYAPCSGPHGQRFASPPEVAERNAAAPRGNRRPCDALRSPHSANPDPMQPGAVPHLAGHTDVLRASK